MTELEKKSLRTIEYHKILALLEDCAVSQRAKLQAKELEPVYNIYECEKLLTQCQDAVLLMGLHGSPYFGGVTDITESVKRADMGGQLNHRELLAIASLLAGVRSCKKYIESEKNQVTSLDEYFERLIGNRFLEDKITSAIISEEEMSDNASSDLYEIRRKIRNSQNKVRDTLNKIITSQTYSKMLQESIVTIRSDRYVVPVKSEYKGAFPGLVHDMSASGATLFIEPLSVVEVNNEIKSLQFAEKQEMDRILFELSGDVAQFKSGIIDDYIIMCDLDFIFAKGKLAYNMNAMRPKLSDSGETRLNRARHPLLEQKTAVPISMEIGGENDTVIVTGPNTGGKTVSIKTLGLLTTMAQSGLFIPADESSVVGIYKNIFADIGDEQSIEQSLSTFSSHMRNIVEILKEADGESLILLDELGAGTDPVEGAALAIAIIEYLRGFGAKIMATTHYAELKIFALETKGVENASCEFDVSTLKPTYKLLFGIPGKSNAFAISEKLGLAPYITEQARLKLNSQNKKFEEVISSLEERRQEFENNMRKAEESRRLAEEQSAKAQVRLKGVDAERERLVEEARKEAREIIRRAKIASDEAFDEIKRVKRATVKNANLSEARAAMRGRLNTAEGEITPEIEVRKARATSRPFVKGDTVKMLSTGIKAVVLDEAKDGKIMLQAGIMRVTARVDEIELVDEPMQDTKFVSTVSLPKTGGRGSTELDLRGKAADEAISELESFMDLAIRAKIPFVTIIHGKGTGVLRSAVHSYLKGLRHIKSFRLGAYGEGEAGVTVVTIV